MHCVKPEIDSSPPDAFPRWPSYSSEEITKVAEVLASGDVNYWTGEEGRKFEKEFAHATQSQYAVAVANGTVALDIIWQAIGLQEGDEVILKMSIVNRRISLPPL